VSAKDAKKSFLYKGLVMVKRPDIIKKFEDDLARKEGRVPYAQAMKIASSLWQEARDLGLLPGKDPLAGIEVDIRLAKVLNSCSKKSSLP
jgi:hypothetical protein